MARLILLKSQQDFKNFQASKSYSSRFLKIRVHFSANQNSPRFGFIVPKKVLPKATDRNKLKRRLKNLMQKYAAKIKSSDVILYPNKETLKLKFLELEKEVQLILEKARLWKY